MDLVEGRTVSPFGSGTHLLTVVSFFPTYVPVEGTEGRSEAQVTSPSASFIKSD